MLKWAAFLVTSFKELPCYQICDSFTHQLSNCNKHFYPEWFRLCLLRYYAIFKVRKFESLFYKLNTSLQKSTTCIRIADRANILSKYIYVFSILGVAFAVLFLCYFQKLQLLLVKNFWTNFLCIVLLFVWAQNMCLRFLKYYFKLEVLIFLSFVLPF